MGHDKLRKFAENETFNCLLQPSSEEVLSNGYFNLKDHPVKGHWSDFFSSLGCPPSERLVLELGCGKGEYTVALAQKDSSGCYVGVDIKGARLWKGAGQVTRDRIVNAAFLRTRIEFITAFFAPSEVSEIWLTFSDPQIRKENARLTSPLFLERYRSFLKKGGLVHLKTDSMFLYQYTLALCEENGLEILSATGDLYAENGLEILPSTGDLYAENGLEILPSTGELHAENGLEILPSTVELHAENGSEQSCLMNPVPGDFSSARMIRTFYENIFIEQGYSIKYLVFRIDHDGEFISPASFDAEHWRSIEGDRQLFGRDTAETRRQKLSRSK